MTVFSTTRLDTNRMAHGLALRVYLLWTFIAVCAFDHVSAQDTVESLALRLRTVERKVSTLVRKNQALTRTLQGVEGVLSKIDQAKGVLTDYPACPLADGFNHVEALKACYKVFPSSVLVNWTDAEALCTAASPRAHLVTIETEEEQHFLRALWANERGVSTLSRYWTGGRMADGEWTWSPGGGALGYEDWIATTNHNDERFECLAVYSNEAFHWLDVACWSSHAVTCEVTVPTSRGNGKKSRKRG